jgi:hypothetical protein
MSEGIRRRKRTVGAPQLRHGEHDLCILTSVHQSIKIEAVRTTITLDDDVYEAARHISRVSGERLGKTLSTLVRRALTPPEAPKKGKAHRFPTFDVPPNSPVIPASRIQRVIDEEGLF